MENKEIKKIIFVCKGNIYRSVIAEKYLKKLLNNKGMNGEFEITSAGINGTAGTKPPKGKNIKDYPEIYKVVKKFIDEKGIDLADHNSSQITREKAEQADLIIVMEKSVLEGPPNSLATQFPNLTYKMRLFSELEGKNYDIPDCENEDQKIHKMVIDTICEKLDKFFHVLIKWIN